MTAGAPDTGESTRSIVAGINARAWADALPKLERGEWLRRPSRLQYAYTPDGMGGLSMAFVKKKVAEGVLEQCGADAWRLVVRRSQ